MRSAPRAVILGLLLVLTAPASSAAEWQFAPFAGFTFKGSTTLVDLEGAVGMRHWNFGGAVTLLGDGPFGVEGYFVHTPGFFQREGGGAVHGENVISSRAYAVMGNAVITIPRAWNRYGLRPYASGGIGRLHVSSQDQIDLFPIRLNLLGMNLGGGAVGFVGDRVGLRFDLRYFRNIRGIDPDEFPAVSIGPVRLRYWTSSVGLVIRY